VPIPVQHSIPALLRTHVRQEIRVPLITRVVRRPVPRLRARQRQVTHVPPAIRVLPIIRAGQGTRVRRIDAAKGSMHLNLQRHGSAILPCRCA